MYVHTKYRFHCKVRQVVVLPLYPPESLFNLFSVVMESMPYYMGVSPEIWFPW